MKCPECGHEFPKHPNRGQFIKTLVKGASNLKKGVKTALKKPPAKRYTIVVDEEGLLWGYKVPDMILEKTAMQIRKYLEYARIKTQIDD
jgi:hypothetical protein